MLSANLFTGPIPKPLRSMNDSHIWILKHQELIWKKQKTKLWFPFNMLNTIHSKNNYFKKVYQVQQILQSLVD